MARALDAGSDAAFTGRTSELRGKETDPQPDRVRALNFFISEIRIDECKAIRELYMKQLGYVLRQQHQRLAHASNRKIRVPISGDNEMCNWFGIIEEDDFRNSYQMSIMYDRQSDIGRLPES